MLEPPPQQDAQTTGAGRPLGYIETLMALSHAELGGTTQCTYELLLHGRAEPEGLRRAAQETFGKYASLRVVIVERGGALHFVMDDDFSRIEIRAATLPSPASWKREVDRELHEPLDAGKALWRVALLSAEGSERHCLVFTFHHAIMDFSAFNEVLMDLLRRMDQEQAEQGASTSIPLPPAIDAFLSPREVEPRAGAARPIPWASHAPLCGRRTRALLDELGAADLARLDALCERERITLNAVLSAILARAAVDAGICTSPVSFKTAVSLRDCARAASAEPIVMGCYMAVAEAELEVDGRGDTALARALERGLMASVVRDCLGSRAFDTPGLRERLSALRSGGAFGGLGMTNIGTLDLPVSFQSFVLEDLVPLANRVAGNHAVVAHVYRSRGTLKTLLVYPEPLLDARTVATIRERFRSGLEALTAGS